MVHCERCGAAAVAEAGSYDYCIQCGLYVCGACWKKSGFCAGCAAVRQRRTFARDMELMRRVDRRLREVTREAVPLQARVATRDLSTALRIDHVCLQLKARSAVRSRDHILNRQLRPRQQAAMATIADRANRHAVASEMLLAKVDAALPAVNGRAKSSELDLDRVRSDRAPGRMKSVLAAAGVACLAGVAVAVLLASQGESNREGTLSGGLATSTEEAQKSASPAAAVATPFPATAPVTLAIAFDDERIGSAEGWDPGEARGSVGVVAFPTSFDRSVRVGTPDGALVSACLTVDPAVPLGSLEVDLILDSAEDVTAGLSLHDSQAGPSLSVGINVGAMLVTAADGSTASAVGAAPGAWHRLTVAAQNTGYDITLDSLDAAAEGPPATRLEIEPIASIGRICLEVRGAPGAAAHYDNLMVNSESPSEG